MITVLPESVLIPTGNYFINDSEEKILETDSFKISKNLVTNSDFYHFIDDTTRHQDFPIHEKQREISHFDDFPVVNIAWSVAIDFCEWMSVKTNLKIFLPTERQWERAARGFDGALYPWGDFYEPTRSPSLDAQSMSASPVGNFPKGASSFGVLDLVGNVWQWTSDKNEFGEVILKGGSWLDAAWGLRTNRSLLADPNLATNTTGFRFVINEGS